MKKGPSDHHKPYDARLVSELPFGSGASPEMLVELVKSTAWGHARVERLRDVEWATRAALDSVLERLIGVAPRFTVIAD